MLISLSLCDEPVTKLPTRTARITHIRVAGRRGLYADLAHMDDFGEFLCTICGEPIGRESYFAAFGCENARMGSEPLWPESVVHRRCAIDYVSAGRRPGDPT